MNNKILRDRSKSLRKKIFQSIHDGNGGHIGGSFSVIDLLNYLYSEVMVFNPKQPQLSSRDRLILSKGHSCLALYWTLAEFGYFDAELIESYGQDGSVFAGHPEYNKGSGIEISSGSLGHGPSIGVGIAHALKLKKINSRVFVIVGDGESNEGSVWEAAMSAAQLKLDNFYIILDNNGMESLDRTDNIMSIEPIDKKFDAFGFDVTRTNGHDFEEIHQYFQNVDTENGRPKCLIADTIKGYGLSFTQGVAKWHFRSPNDEELKLGLKELST
ncbi:transketolase [Gammaproteobacteria bacterium]|jgi:transketolase|nr:transketolase [Gammaproteobacteria bacterium]|tara:strand:- start:851 stop:1663 length:813 start_codon:yes stop_codon:yes gene_type:complete